jgi:hypothetical protein
MIRAAKPASSRACDAAATLAAVVIDRLFLPPRRMIWLSSLPVVEKMAEWPALVRKRNDVVYAPHRWHRVATLTPPSSGILEAHRAGQPGGQFTVNLTLGRPGTDSTPGNQVGNVLGVIKSRYSVAEGIPL